MSSRDGKAWVGGLVVALAASLAGCSSGTATPSLSVATSAPIAQATTAPATSPSPAASSPVTPAASFPVTPSPTTPSPLTTSPAAPSVSASPSRIEAPTGLPSSIPSLSQSPSPSPSGTRSPSPSASRPSGSTGPSGSATLSPGHSPDRSGSPSASGAPQPSVAADSTLLFADDFSIDESGWGIGDLGPGGTIDWADGALRFAADDAQGSLQSAKALPAGTGWEEIAAGADFTPSIGADTLMGIYCSPGDGRLIAAVISVQGGWAVLRGTRDTVEIVDRGTAAGVPALGATWSIAVQCSGSTEDRPALVRLAIQGTTVATVDVAVPEAMRSFTALGVWVEPVTPPMVVTVDDVHAVGRHTPPREGDEPPASPPAGSTGGANPSATASAPASVGP